MLSDEVVSVSSVGSFMRNLDGFWCDLDFYYNYKSDVWYFNNSIKPSLVFVANSCVNCIC